MAHNLNTMADGRSSLAFRGDRNDIWHRLGQQFDPSWSIDDWARNAGMDWEAIKVPAIADMTGLAVASNFNIGVLRGLQSVADRYFIARADNGCILAPQSVSKQYQIVQPRQCLDLFAQFISADDRFQLDTAMCLKNGEIVAVNAIFNGDISIAGDRHKARLLASTTFDGSGSTIGKGVVTRTVCNNTLDAGLAERGGPVLRIRHSTKFDEQAAGKQLADVLKGFVKYKTMGDYMATRKIAESDVSRLFKLTLDIDPVVKREDISTKKWNQFEELVGAYQVGTRNEGLTPNTAWSALQGVTRYVDHNKTTKLGGMSEPEARFVSANFAGTGAAMKAQAVQYLDDICDGDIVRHVDSQDWSALMNQPFKPAAER